MYLVSCCITSVYARGGCRVCRSVDDVFWNGSAAFEGLKEGQLCVFSAQNLDATGDPVAAVWPCLQE
jgi:hypothetical protein